MKVMYQNREVYVGKDLTGSINYFGSASTALIADDFTRDRRRSVKITREILWESATATDQEVRVVEARFIRSLKANDPAVGYNRLPRFRPAAAECPPSMAATTDALPSP